MSAPTVTSRILAFPALDPADAVAHFTHRLSVEADVSDVHTDLAAGVAGLVLVDTRNDAAWAAGHVAEAIHLPTAQIPARAAEVIPAGTLVVTYCWGPACNGATKASLAFARLGYRVKEMIGGYEYWVREGLPVLTAAGVRAGTVDPLTAPAFACDC